MQAEKWVLKTDEQGKLRGLPALPPCTQVEVIVLYSPTPIVHPRKPPVELAGQVTLLGDMIQPLVPTEDWDALN